MSRRPRQRRRTPASRRGAARSGDVAPRTEAAVAVGGPCMSGSRLRCRSDAPGGGVRGADRGARKTDRRGDAAHPTGSPPEREAAARLRLRIGRFPHAGVPRNGKSCKKSRSGQRTCGFCRTVFPAAQAPGNHACGLSSPAVNIRRTPLRSENPIFRNGNTRTVRFFLQLVGSLYAAAASAGQEAGIQSPPGSGCRLGMGRGRPGRG